MQSGYELFSVRGVTVKLHSSFVLIGALLGLLALGGGGDAITVLLRLSAPLLLFVTVVIHEVGHAIMAQRLGVAVLDIVLTPLGGAARLAGRLDDSKKEIAIAAAGPLTNLALAGVLYALFVALGRAHEVTFERTFLLDGADDTLIAADPLPVFFTFNVLLGTLNLVPAFPMDGGRILRGGLALAVGRLRATRTACRIGLWIALMLILLPFFVRGTEWWITPFLGIYLIVAGLKERIAIEATEGMFKHGIRSFRLFTAGGTGGFPPDGAGAPGGTAGPLDADEHEESPERIDGVIDVPGHSRIIRDDSEEPTP